jgi:hypothetical protein
MWLLLVLFKGNYKVALRKINLFEKRENAIKKEEENQ